MQSYFRAQGHFVFLSAVVSLAGNVRTLIALHHGRKTTMNMKSELFVSCRGRVNISTAAR